MRRREFIGGLGGAAVCALAPSAYATEAARRIGVLVLAAESDPLTKLRMAALHDGMKTLGWTEGRNLQIEYRFAGADAQRVAKYAAELVDLAPDVIVTGATPATMAVQRLTNTVPIVFVEVTNEVGYGVTGKLARPGANATGITNLYAAIGARWLELLKEAAPRINRVALLYNPEFDTRGYIAAIEAAAAIAAFDIAVIKTPIRDADDLEREIPAFATQPNGALLVLSPAPSFTNVELIFRLATRYRLPAIYPIRGYAARGGLMDYGADSVDLFHQAASYVDRILRGEKPGDLMVGFPTKFGLEVNLKAAKSIGLEIPRALLDRADEIIQ